MNGLDSTGYLTTLDPVIDAKKQTDIHATAENFVGLHGSGAALAYG